MTECRDGAVVELQLGVHVCDWRETYVGGLGVKELRDASKVEQERTTGEHQDVLVANLECKLLHHQSVGDLQTPCADRNGGGADTDELNHLGVKVGALHQLEPRERGHGAAVGVQHRTQAEVTR
eukprot:Mycagemm_TRINITY_DN10262_c0_g1::TRINITY_DN10262_c0_g1_i1::g.3636::m.3636 type:complete len:124 gc:universal TRINITY_DN10262_c0_g1_i1:994-623(-)